jgi:alanyl-tRNA synthetase
MCPHPGRKPLQAILLDRTIFYPEGGGQPGDRGTINGVALVEVIEAGGEIFHLVEDASGLSPGPGELILDRRRRRDYSLHHSAQHLLSGTILKKTGKPTLSMHLGEEICTIDVDVPELSGETLLAIEDEVMDAIEEDASIITHLCPPEELASFPLRKVPPQGEEVIRVVEIRGHDFSPCCGTHLKHTGEIGLLRILGAEKYKGMTRISFIAGRRCLRDSRLLRENCSLISRRLSVPVGETGRGVEALLEKTAALELRLKGLEEAAAATRAQALLQKPPTPRGFILETYPDAPLEEVLRIGRAAQKETDRLIVLASRRDCKFAAFSGDKKGDLRSLFGPALAAQGGKGGGGGGFFQGSFPTPEALEGFLGEISG